MDLLQGSGHNKGQSRDTLPQTDVSSASNMIVTISTVMHQEDGNNYFKF